MLVYHHCPLPPPRKLSGVARVFFRPRSFCRGRWKNSLLFVLRFTPCNLSRSFIILKEKGIFKNLTVHFTHPSHGLLGNLCSLETKCNCNPKDEIDTRVRSVFGLSAPPPHPPNFSRKSAKKCWYTIISPPSPRRKLSRVARVFSAPSLSAGGDGRTRFSRSSLYSL